MSETWLTLAEAANYLKVSRPTIYRLCAERRLPYYKLAGTGARRFRASDLEGLMVPGQPGETPRPNAEGPDRARNQKRQRGYPTR